MRICLLVWLMAATPLVAGQMNILLIAGPKTHEPGAHEFPAGCELLAKRLLENDPGLHVEVCAGWPDASRVQAADSIVIYGDGLEKHPAKGHIAELRRHYEAGKGLVVLHFALEPGNPETARLLDDAIGGRFEIDWSVNPVWKMENPTIADHPVTRGVRPFSMEDEFYYHLRLRESITPLLQAHPPMESLGADGPRSGNPSVRKDLAGNIPQTLAWVVENPNGSRGFGFTGGHFFRNWAQEDLCRLVLNAIIWTARVDVPEQGVAESHTATPASQSIEEAIARGDLEDVRLHLSSNPASLNRGRDKTHTPLSLAVLRNKTDIALLLLEAGADPNGQDASLRTPLHLAVERGNPILVTALLKAGAKPDLRDKTGWTPLHHAAAKNRTEIARSLLDGGANPMTLSELGGTPLHEAAASAGPELVQLLLDHHVDPSVRSKEGTTALDIAKKCNNQAAIQVLSRFP